MYYECLFCRLKSQSTVASKWHVYDRNFKTYHTCYRFAGTSPQTELGPDKYWGSLHSREGPGHDTILLARKLVICMIVSSNTVYISKTIWLIRNKQNEKSKTLKHFVKYSMLNFSRVC